MQNRVSSMWKEEFVVVVVNTVGEGEEEMKDEVVVGNLRPFLSYENDERVCLRDSRSCELLYNENYRNPGTQSREKQIREKRVKKKFQLTFLNTNG